LFEIGLGDVHSLVLRSKQFWWPGLRGIVLADAGYGDERDFDWIMSSNSTP